VISREWLHKGGEVYERRERIDAHAVCPRCGQEVELIADTEEWKRSYSGRWRHSSYGPALGECCGQLIVDSFDGCKVYELSA
jgi:hypothetical protein